MRANTKARATAPTRVINQSESRRLAAGVGFTRAPLSVQSSLEVRASGRRGIVDLLVPLLGFRLGIRFAWAIQEMDVFVQHRVCEHLFVGLVVVGAGRLPGRQADGRRERNGEREGRCRRPARGRRPGGRLSHPPARRWLPAPSAATAAGPESGNPTDRGPRSTRPPEVPRSGSPRRPARHTGGTGSAPR